MYLQTIELHFDVSLELPVRLLLDPSEDSWQAVRQKALDLMEIMVGRVEGLAFAGCCEFHSLSLPGEFDRKIQGIYRKVKNIPVLIGPILESWQKHASSFVTVLITGKRPIDLDDWTGRPEGHPAPKLIIVNLEGKEFQDEIPEFLSSDPLESILDEANNPPVSIFVEGDGFFPLECKTNQGALDLDFYDNQMRLKLNNWDTSQRLSLRLKSLGLTDPFMVIERRNGTSEKKTGQEISSYFNQPIWTPLTDAAWTVIQAGINRQDFECPFCRDYHAYQTVFCPNLGRFLLDGIPSKSVVIIDRQQRKFLSLTDALLAWQSGHDRIITMDGMMYSWEDFGWMFLNEITPYENLGNDFFGLYTEG